MKTIAHILIFWFAIMIFAAFPVPEGACTTAVIRPEASADGRPLLWKNRDTDFISNKVIFVNEVPFSYIGLVNAEETSGRWVYAGLNSTGFGIMNSVAYNLPEKDKEMKDLEGQIMADALRTCRTADDFEHYLQKNLGASLGSWANFGVIDGSGNAVIFEVYNHGISKLDAVDADRRYLINTNFARSGEKGEGAGFLRFERATRLFSEQPGQKFSPPLILRNFSRDLGNMLIRQPTLKDLETVPADPPVWIYYRDCINRPYTSAAVVISGKKPGDEHSLATFWVILGEPISSIAIPLWVEAGQVPDSLWKGKDAPIYEQSYRIKKTANPWGVPDREYYLKINRLVNRDGTGFLPRILETEQEIFRETETFLKQKRNPNQLAEFQDKMAEKVLTTLENIK
jgi:hypothetical protein